ncbi:MAG: hypothetical protein EXQ90_06595 [Rhodospirillales bacterium]|nr:hypothetical protein [Rhodospirillales bacterium]
MRGSILFIAGIAAVLCFVAPFPAASAEDCLSVTPQQWIASTCELSDLRMSLSKRLDEPSKAMIAGNCSSTPPERWLPGTWKVGETTLTVARDGDGFDWKMDRAQGQVSQTWGEKETARGAGRVSSIEGCKAILKGAYTAFGGAGAKGRNPIGWQMDYTLDLIAPTVLAGAGIGYGQRPFRIIFTRQK